MAKVINPLLSGSASGQLGHMMVFDKRGRVRQYVVPANPQTVDQMDVRNTLGDIQRTLKLLGTKLRGELKVAFGPTWNSQIVGELTANSGAVLSAYTAEFTAFQAGEKTAYENVDQASPIKLTKGAVIYSCASAVYDMKTRMGATVTIPLPANANAAAVGAAWVLAA
jgi:hypothetical protein